MEKNEIEQLRNRLCIEEVAEQRLGLDVVRHRCRCCFHSPDRHPSMSFNVARGTYRCWSCGAHGDVFSLTQHVLGLTFPEALRWLSNEALYVSRSAKTVDCAKPSEPVRTFNASRYEHYFEHPWLSAAARGFLFDVRRLDPEAVASFRLNSYGDWLQIPYYNRHNILVGIQRRYMGNDPAQPRFLFPKGEECHLYNQQVLAALEPDEEVCLAEGPSDVWALASSKRKAVGIPSATLLKPRDLLPLRGRVAHVWPDKDSAGEKLYAQLLRAANDVGFCLIRHELPGGCKDFSDYWMMSKALPVTRYP